MNYDYEMAAGNPCPSCRGSHHFGVTDGVPVWDPSIGVAFRVICPMTGATVEVVVPPSTDLAPATVIGAQTDTLCPVCQKANFTVAREVPSSSVVMVQYLECANQGCRYEMMRRWNSVVNRPIPEND